MMPEASDKGNNPMQTSESTFNEKYPRKPNGITDLEYSIEIGIKTLSDCFKQASVKDPFENENIYLALKVYNYSNGYICARLLKTLVAIQKLTLNSFQI